MPPSMFTVYNQINGSNALVEAFKRYAPLGLRLHCTEENYSIAYDHTLKDYMYYSRYTTEPMTASWRWLGSCNEIFEVTRTPTLALQKLH